MTVTNAFNAFKSILLEGTGSRKLVIKTISSINPENIWSYSENIGILKNI